MLVADTDTTRYTRTAEGRVAISIVTYVSFLIFVPCDLVMIKYTCFRYIGNNVLDTIDNLGLERAVRLGTM